MMRATKSSNFRFKRDMMIWVVLLMAASIGSGAIPEHDAITEYNGPQTCVPCHQSEATAMFGSMHYQWSGPTPAVPNITGDAGKAAGGFNTYCGSPLGSRRIACWSCHVGNGKVPTEDLGPEQLNNIDCMMCHSEAYQRKAVPPFPTADFNYDRYVNFSDVWLFVGSWLDNGCTIEDGCGGLDLSGNGNITLADYSLLALNWGDCTVADAPCNYPWTETLMYTDYLGTEHTWTLPREDEEGNLQFGPDTDNMPVDIVEAARKVHLPTRATCLRCHAYAAGSDGAKRGDLSSATVDPSANRDIHMSSAGADLACRNCHASPENHHELGRGVDLRPSDYQVPRVPLELMTCTSGGCHPTRPHTDTQRNDHTGHIACQTCHIPMYAKNGITTEMARDWTVPVWTQTLFGGQGGYKPKETRADYVTPTYAWFDGTSNVYVLGQVAVQNSQGQYELASPNGSVQSADADIYPMKEHTSNSALHDATGQLIPHATSTYFFTGDFDRAVEDGMANVGLEGSWTMVQVHTFQSINHGVEPKANALGCGKCHSSYTGGPVRMDLQGDLGYAPKAPNSTICTQCHSLHSSSFSSTHSRHVTNRHYDCSWCHTFSRPERGLTMP